MKYILCLVYLICSLSGLAFMKLGSMEDKKVLFHILHMKFTVQSISGYCLYIASFLIYTVLITKFELSRLVPVLGGIVNIFVFIMGIVLFHEKFTAGAWIGCICIVTGIVLMGKS